MARTDMLRRQHDAAIAIVEEISASIFSYRDPRDAYGVALQLTKLKGLLRIHFAQEDRSLYPAMMSNSDPKIAATATAFQKEMGDLGPAFETFAARWGTSAAISADFHRFREESADLFGKLADRVERENEYLYPLADAVVEDLRPAECPSVH